MHMLAELVEVVIGVDTHKHTHTAAVVAGQAGSSSVPRFARVIGRSAVRWSVAGQDRQGFAG
jgi:hypothetical protein